MPALSRAPIFWSLEEYAERRPGFRQQVMTHKKTHNCPRRACLAVF